MLRNGIPVTPRFRSHPLHLPRRIQSELATSGSLRTNILRQQSAYPDTLPTLREPGGVSSPSRRSQPTTEVPLTNIKMTLFKGRLTSAIRAGVFPMHCIGRLERFQPTDACLRVFGHGAIRLPCVERRSARFRSTVFGLEQRQRGSSRAESRWFSDSRTVTQL